MIREWMVLRVIFNSEVRGVLGGVIELDDTLEPQVIAYTVKIDVRNAIPEDIMKPSHLKGLGRYIERKIGQSLIKTVPRACHQLMPAEPYLALVVICRTMKIVMISLQVLVDEGLGVIFGSDNGTVV